MRDFDYRRVDDLEQATQLLGEPESIAIAGGTELLNWMRLGIAEPRTVVDIGRVEDTATIEVDGDWLRIGALSVLNEIAADPLVATHAGALAEACVASASPQVRNRATLGGNVLQKTRCPYFRAEDPLPWGCNKRRPGSGCSAREGVNGDAAIFGWTDDCVATQPSDPLTALACLDAEVEIVGEGGTRSVPALELHLTQEEAAADGGDAARLETRLRPGEIIAGYRLPIRAGGRSAYVKVRERRSYAYALVSAAASVRLEGDVIASAQIALGSVAQRPWRLHESESALVGLPLEAGALESAIDLSLAEARPLAGNAYKIALSRGAAVRALTEAAGR